MPEFVGAIDCGTTSARFFIFDQYAKVIASHQAEYKQIYPQPGWHEQDPRDWVQAIDTCITHAIADFKKMGHQITDLKTMGITNQRETTIVWDKTTGQSLYNAIAWSDSRTTPIVHRFENKASQWGQGADQLKGKTGLPLSNYFTAIKLRWLIDNVPAVQAAMDSDNILVGTVDTYLLWHYTGGINGGSYYTDVTNASRTMLMDLETLDWCPELMNFFGFNSAQLIPLLPKIVSNSENLGSVPSTHPDIPGLLISGLIGDQQSSLVGNQCFSAGESKNTYGTGCFMLYNAGTEPVYSSHGLITTPGYRLGPDGPTTYALEGAVAVAGSSIQWLKNNLGLISSAGEVGTLAASVDDTGGVYFVTGFSGLFAPYWDDSATGLMIGLTGFTTKAHIARATLEATCFQTKAILDAMALDQGLSSSRHTSPPNSAPPGGSFFSHNHSASTSSTSSTFSTYGMPQTPTAKRNAPTRPRLQTRESLGVYDHTLSGPLKSLKVDGGMSASDTLLQLQADILGVVVERSEMKETTALGAALLAGHAIGLFGWDLNRPETLFATHSAGKTIFRPSIPKTKREQRYRGWNRAVTRAKGWLENDDIDEEETIPDCVEIVDHDQVMLVEGLSNVYFGEEGQPVFRREHEQTIVLDPLSKRPLIA
ncbi:Glycerol kinase [Puccinia graminis f. sp. tritici]|uniref:glycerol kinase n=2 Tax=Puccinia graminis f. sp. tritici TaxID=56615 RepID=E3KU32_PUCGT|nr:glycerol kinase [Puccinia graminis f. sp. tritici CRL 75-36-700-3]EFP87807.2 glycerol kinase [Puccinia graminis f. sp. tritici CRL 75-36-700-3]KAA1108070.1 Glycerol kinase [Puccinia graminis f. sp. tritici]KAA1113398.1 Glycerol kinase [Puccinia graminis f. sp. tritici]